MAEGVRAVTAHDPYQVATAYLGLFAPRTDVYQRWTADGWRPVREAVTPALVVEGLQKRGPTIGAYHPAADATTHVLALDIDREDGWDIARRVVMAMWSAEVPAFLERSRRGAHVWATLAASVPSVLARAALRTFLADAGAPTDPKIELRPASDRPTDLGHALRLPMMPHGATGQRWPLCWPDGKPLGTAIADIVLAAWDVDWGTPDAIRAAAERWSPEVDPKTIPSAFRRPRRGQDDPGDVGPILAELGVPFKPGHAVRCPFHDDRNPSLSIASDGRRVFCKNPECEAANGGRGLGANQLRKLVDSRRAAA